MSSFKGFAVLQRPADLVAKLEHDLERIRAAPDDAYAAFDFLLQPTTSSIGSSLTRPAGVRRMRES
jgi:hypothetical protein